MALDRPFYDGRVQTANVAVKASIASENIINDLVFVFRSKRTLHFRHFTLDETADTSVADQRGKRKSAELHTRGAKRAETWQWGVKW